MDWRECCSSAGGEVGDEVVDSLADPGQRLQIVSPPGDCAAAECASTRSRAGLRPAVGACPRSAAGRAAVLVAGPDTPASPPPPPGQGFGVLSTGPNQETWRVGDREGHQGQPVGKTGDTSGTKEPNYADTHGSYSGEGRNFPDDANGTTPRWSTHTARLQSPEVRRARSDQIRSHSPEVRGVPPRSAAPTSGHAGGAYIASRLSF